MYSCVVARRFGSATLGRRVRMSEADAIKDLLGDFDFERRLIEAYRRGLRDGASMTREKILRAASDPDLIVPAVTVEQLGTSTAETNRNSTPQGRVAHGTVRPLVQRVLKENPGMTKSETARKVAAIDQRIAQASVGNELNRNKDTLYRCVDGNWYCAERLEQDATEAASDSLRRQGDGPVLQ